MEAKTCSKCGETKALSEFYKRGKPHAGLMAHCKACHRQYPQFRRSPEQNKVRDLKRHYGLTHSEWIDRLERQGRRCAICGRAFEESRDIHTDHCHETGKFRGLLCMGCNTGLGKLGDNEEGLLKALAYLRGELVSV